MAEAQNNPDSDFSDEELSPLDVAFNKAADHVRKITSMLNNNQLLELYALYKQGTEGKCNVPRPGWLDGYGRRKWDAWNAMGEMPMEQAKEKYIQLLHKYDPDFVLPKQAVSGAKETWAAVSSMMHTPEPELDINNLSILDAAREDLGEVVSELLKKNPKLKYEKDVDGLSVLHWAADRDATKALAAAIKGGCPVNAIDNSGQTALHYAVLCDHLNSTKILIDAGAALLKDNENYTPLDLANDNEMRKLLEGAK